MPAPTFYAKSLTELVQLRASEYMSLIWLGDI